MTNDERMTKFEARNLPVCVPRIGRLSYWLDRARDLAQNLTAVGDDSSFVIRHFG
jgi:hypothetical protein